LSSKDNNLSKGAESQLPDVSDKIFAVIVSDWNDDITHAMMDACVQTLRDNGVGEDKILISHVPGAYELPIGARLVMSREKVDAAICIGCVIKGETQHDQYINNAVAQGIMNLSLATTKPVIFGVLTPNDHQQAVDRAGGKHGNKGVEAAVTAIRMVDLARGAAGGKGRIGFG